MLGKIFKIDWSPITQRKDLIPPRMRRYWQSMFSSDQSSTRLWFWLGFIVLNTLILLPLYLIYGFGSSDFFPFSDLIFEDAADFYQKLSVRQNYDVFRISSDVVFIAYGLWLVRKFRFRNAVRNTLFVVYLILLIFTFYYWTFEKLFGGANLYDDLSQLGFISQISQTDIGWLMLLYALVLAGAIIGLFKFYTRFTDAVFNIEMYYVFGKKGRGEVRMGTFRVTRFEQILFVLVLVLTAYQLKRLYRKEMVFWPEATLQSTVSRLVESSRSSKREGKLIALKNHIHRHQDNRDVRIDKQAPNLYFLFIESYGDIVTEAPELKNTFTPLLAKLEEQLDEHDWHVSSNLSRSTTIGGRSWLAYTSFLYGFNLDSHKHYLDLIQFAPSYEYPSITKIIHSSGYKNFRLTSIRASSKVYVPYKRFSHFHTIDEWITNKDLNYTGKSYGFGPAPPEQFSLNFAQEYIRAQKLEEPYSLFYITQNSHNPFVTGLKVVEDWRSLDDGSEEPYKRPGTNFFKIAKMEDYRLSMVYQLNVIIDFVIKQGSDNDIFLLMGDHQPPLVTPRGSSVNTPVHIVSKNKAFIDGFSVYGFVPGMQYENTSTATHEGLHHAFLRELVRHFSSGTRIPTYYPEGVPLKPNRVGP